MDCLCQGLYWRAKFQMPGHFIPAGNERTPTTQWRCSSEFQQTRWCDLELEMTSSQFNPQTPQVKKKSFNGAGLWRLDWKFMDSDPRCFLENRKTRHQSPSCVNISYLKHTVCMAYFPVFFSGIVIWLKSWEIQDVFEVINWTAKDSSLPW